MLSLKQITDETTWESFLEKRKDQNFLQSWCWGKVQEELGKKIFRLGIYCSGKGKGTSEAVLDDFSEVEEKRKHTVLQGIALLIKEKAKRGNYLACPAGPLLNWQNKELFPFLVDEIKKITKREKVSFIRIRPQLLNTPENLGLFKKLGFISAPMHMHAETTWQLDLSKSEEELLKGMNKGHRYEIRKAEKRGVKISFSKDSKDVDLLYEMQLETAKRHKFVPFNKKRLQAEFKSFLKNDNVLLFKAMLQEKTIACAFFIYYGKEAVYHYSATTQEARKVSAAYATLWEAIKEAKKREMKYFNFWGIAPGDKKQHRFTKLNHFKKGFGGFEVDYLHAQDLPIKPTYWLTFVFETLRRKFRKL